MYADKILIKSGAMKELFVNHLTAFAGKGTRAVWNEKIETIGAFTGTEDLKENREDGAQADRTGQMQTEQKKTLLYCIGENEFFENTAAALDKVKERLDVITQYPDSFKAAVCLYPYDIAMWDIVSEQEKENIVQVLKEYQKNKNIEFLSEDTIDIDRMTAYYGSPSPLICRFVKQHKPAMVSESSFE